ncbi:MAG TPA: lasso peptide biosynthesis B2 protein, partial [Gemmatimonadaceae bacterium]|nr:lasso peptide biosynthesis B2 protein [Gemmatimonadaceae bacterium]
ARELLRTPVPGWARHELRPRGLVRRHLALLAPVPRALGAYHPGPTESRLAQLWVLAGDHGIRRVLAWLETQGYDGPVRRWRAERERTGGASRAAGKLKLAACQLALHARGNPAPALAGSSTRLWRDRETAGAPRLASLRRVRNLLRHRADAVPLALAFWLLPLTVARLRGARTPVVVCDPDGGAPAPAVSPERLARALRLARVVELAARHGVASGNCLSRSLTLLDLMAREGLGGELRIGVRTGDGGIDAHAWVELDGRVLNDGADVDRHFAPLRDVRRTSSTRAP